MSYSASDYNILSYLLKHNLMSYDSAIAWAYAQYTDDGIDSFIEKISLAVDVAEMAELISNEFQVCGEPGGEFLVGETATMYFTNQISLNAAINRVLFDLDVDLPEKERTELYIAEDYYGWHGRPDHEALKHVLPIFERFKPVYESMVGKFKV